MEQAIKLAQEGGYNLGELPPLLEMVKGCIATTDPRFWQALGKTLGWKNRRPYMSVVGVRDYYISPEITSAELATTIVDEWQINWHRLITHQIAGKSPDSFFESLLTNTKSNE